MERSDVPDAWVGLRVRARIKTNRGGEYLVLGWLADVDDAGVKIMAGSPSGEARSYPWECIAGVEPLGS
jgi:hypothetical protein